jgi:hypothetical protein
MIQSTRVQYLHYECTIDQCLMYGDNTCSDYDHTHVSIVLGLVDGIQVHKVITVSQSKSGNVWFYNTVCTWSPLT